ncbi:unnamed protein product [Gadus morhua 'NCC']
MADDHWASDGRQNGQNGFSSSSYTPDYRENGFHGDAAHAAVAGIVAGCCRPPVCSDVQCSRADIALKGRRVPTAVMEWKIEAVCDITGFLVVHRLLLIPFHSDCARLLDPATPGPLLTRRCALCPRSSMSVCRPRLGVTVLVRFGSDAPPPGTVEATGGGAPHHRLERGPPEARGVGSPCRAPGACVPPRKASGAEVETVFSLDHSLIADVPVRPVRTAVADPPRLRC